METAKFEKLKAIDKLVAGPEMDETIARQFIENALLDDYSTYPGPSEKVVEKLKNLGLFVVDGQRGPTEFICTIVKGKRDIVTSYEATLPLARCRAALKAMLEE